MSAYSVPSSVPGVRATTVNKTGLTSQLSQTLPLDLTYFYFHLSCVDTASICWQIFSVKGQIVGALDSADTWSLL